MRPASRWEIAQYGAKREGARPKKPRALPKRRKMGNGYLVSSSIKALTAVTSLSNFSSASAWVLPLAER